MAGSWEMTAAVDDGVAIAPAGASALPLPECARRFVHHDDGRRERPPFGCGRPAKRAAAVTQRCRRRFCHPPQRWQAAGSEGPEARRRDAFRGVPGAPVRRFSQVAAGSDGSRARSKVRSSLACIARRLRVCTMCRRMHARAALQALRKNVRTHLDGCRCEAEIFSRYVIFSCGCGLKAPTSSHFVQLFREAIPVLELIHNYRL